MPALGFLAPSDLRQLTGAARVNAQEAWLKAEGIPCRRNGKDGLVVAWGHVNTWLEGRTQPVGRGMNWGALNA